MIYYLIDLLFNSLNLFKSCTILINIDKYSKDDFIYILLVDIFINKIPIIFITLVLIVFINKYLSKNLVSSFLVESIIFIIDYLVFITVIFIIFNYNFSINSLGISYVSNFIINYFCFLVFRNEKNIFKRIDKNEENQ